METTREKFSRGQAKGVRRELARRRRDAGIGNTSRSERRAQRMVVLASLGFYAGKGGMNTEAFSHFCGPCGRKTVWKDGRCSMNHRPATPVVVRPKPAVAQPVHRSMEMYEWCEPCGYRTLHRDGKCTQHESRWCDACNATTTHRFDECTKHRMVWCDPCSKVTTHTYQELSLVCRDPSHKEEPRGLHRRTFIY